MSDDGLPLFEAKVFDPVEYAALRYRLDFFDDLILGTRFDSGQPAQVYGVDPTELGERLGQLPVSSGFLSGRVLFWQRRGGAERLGLWVPPRVWTLQLAQRGYPDSLRLPLPGFVLVGQARNYELWAVKGRERPGPDEPLYRPPVPNVSGTVCQGSVDFPEAAADTMRAAADAFFGSGFNSHLSTGKSFKYDDGILRMWRVLDRARAQHYPEYDLVSAGRKLRGLL